ncbi:MAG: hypothetical protein MUO85_00580 [candidate division Zixibacteria bacterium]|nr:hypothetical protein [candidate division Zixibacteria bacterium]
MFQSKTSLSILITSILIFFGCTKSPVNNPLVDHSDIYFEVTESRIVMHHLDAVYDCCAVIGVVVTQKGTIIDFVEKDYSADKCNSFCTLELKGTSNELGSGCYDCRVWNSDMSNIVYQSRVCMSGDEPG